MNLLERIYQKRFTNLNQRKMLWRILIKDFFQQYFNKNDTVLDLACGRSEFINNLICKNKLAVDLNPEVKKYANKDVKIYIEPSTKMQSIKSHSVDKIFVSNFLEHLNRDDIILTIVEFNRILKKDGEVLILQPNIRFLGKDYWMFFDHLTPIDDRAIEELFAAYGFTLKKKILKFLPYTTKSRLPQSPFFVKAYLKLPFLWWIFGKQTFWIFKKRL